MTTTPPTGPDAGLDQGTDTRVDPAVTSDTGGLFSLGDDEVFSAAAGTHGHPHAVLGAHPRGGRTAVRVVRPLAETVTVTGAFAIVNDATLVLFADCASEDVVVSVAVALAGPAATGVTVTVREVAAFASSEPSAHVTVRVPAS